MALKRRGAVDGRRGGAGGRAGMPVAVAIPSGNLVLGTRGTNSAACGCDKHPERSFVRSPANGRRATPSSRKKSDPSLYAHAVQQMNRRQRKSAVHRLSTASFGDVKIAASSEKGDQGRNATTLAPVSATGVATKRDESVVDSGVAYNLAQIDRRERAARENRADPVGSDGVRTPPSPVPRERHSTNLNLGAVGVRYGTDTPARKLRTQTAPAVALNPRMSTELRLKEKIKTEQRRAEVLALNRVLARRDAQNFAHCLAVVGGSNVYGQAKTVWQYSPQVGVWRKLCQLLESRCNAASCATPRGDLVSCGGYITGGTFVDTVEIYEPRLKASRMLTPMPHGVYGGRACCIGDKLFVVGGQSCEEVKAMKTLLVYSFSQAKWTEGQPMREARRFPGLCVVPDGSIVVTGGQSANGQALKSAERFFPSHGRSGRWSPLPDLTTGRYAHASVLLPDNRIGVFGSHTRSRNCEALDLETNEWLPLPAMSHGRAHPAAACVGDIAFVIGGTKASAQGDEFLSTGTDGIHRWQPVTLRPQDQEGRGRPGIGTPMRECSGVTIQCYNG